MISQHTIDQVRDLNIVQVVEKYINLKKTGSSYTAKSPFVQEKTPSFHVSPAKNIFKCFSTGIGGDAISFVREHLNLGFYDAIKELANQFGIPIEYEDLTPAQQKERQQLVAKQDELLKINEAAARQYGMQLIETDANHPAFKELIDNRQYTGDTIIQWQLGYAPGGTNGYEPKKWQFLYKQLKEKALVIPAVTLGLVKDKNGTYYDAFRNRIIFPIHNPDSRIVGFGGRTLDANDKKLKYINSSESEIFNKSKLLYGLNFAAKPIRKQEFAYLVEGYTDVISFHQAGITNTVGSCGTSLTKEQIKLLKKYTTRVVVAYDADAPGIKKAITATDLLLEAGFTVHICSLPAGQDPDTFVRTNKNNIAKLLKELEIEGIEFKANHLLSGANSVQRDDRFNDIARSLAMLKLPVMQSDIGRKIAKQYGLDWGTMKRLIDTHKEIKEKKDKLNQVIRKNKIVDLQGQANIYPFFEEQFTKDGGFKGIYINRVKLIQLLKSFGYYRYEIVEDSSYTFVQIKENLIKTIQRDNIIDHIESFIQNEYDFDAAGFEYIDAEGLVNKFYSSLGSYFSKDLFARLKPDEQILINRDTKDATYFYYQNGFVKVTAKGVELLPYEKLQGSIWEDQTLDRKFTPLKGYSPNREIKDIRKLGVFADFVYKISGQDAQRFYSLCSIIGYLSHDYYDYKLKAILFTDSTLSDLSEGRTGKSLLGKLIGQVRSYCEINGKDFDPNDKKKYQDARLDTQMVHLNDVKHQGRNRFQFEDMFNDITEGYIVDGKWMKPFRKQSKFIISSNRTINIQGASQIDRITEYEMSSFFNVDHRPEEEYGHWFMRDWDDKEWNRYDNFMCYCAQVFHQESIIAPNSINLELRKLKDHTNEDFLEFMVEIKNNLAETSQPFASYYQPEGKPIGAQETRELTEFVFDKRKLQQGFIEMFPDWENNRYFTLNRFTGWLRLYADKMLGLKKMKEWRANGRAQFQFVKPEETN